MKNRRFSFQEISQRRKREVGKNTGLPRSKLGDQKKSEEGLLSNCRIKWRTHTMQLEKMSNEKVRVQDINNIGYTESDLNVFCFDKEILKMHFFKYIVKLF